MTTRRRPALAPLIPANGASPGPAAVTFALLVVDPNDPDRFYFGTLDGQIYISTDAGRNWRLLVNFNRPRLFVDHIIVDPRNSKVTLRGDAPSQRPGRLFQID